MKLSIIIPIYNVEKYLNRCIDSVLQQVDFDMNDENIEILLINDGSPDNSQDIIESYSQKISYVKAFMKENGGISDARNFGISKATGDYIWFIDSDDWIQENSFAVIFKEIEKNDLDIFEFSWSETFQIAGGYKYVRDDYYESLGIDKIVSGKKFLNEFGYVVSPWNKVVRKTLYSDIVFPLNTYVEDNLITLYLLKKCKRFKKVAIPLYNYFSREESTTKTNDRTHIDKYYKGRLELSINLKNIIDNNVLKLDNYDKIEDANRFFIINLLYDIVRNQSVFEAKVVVERLEQEGLYPILYYRYHNKGWKRELFRLVINQKKLIPFACKLFSKK